MKQLSHSQIEVLRWIADGSPERDWPDYGHRVSARTLASRGLVVVRGRGEGWRAEVTDRGRQVLAGGLGSSSRGTSRKPREPADGPTGAELLRALVDEAGELRVDAPRREVRAAYRRALAAIAREQVPEGKRVTHTGRDKGDLVIRLVDADVVRRPDEPVALPTVVDDAHEVVRHLRQNIGGLDIAEASRQRVLLLVQSIADECARRGHVARVSSAATTTFELAVDAEAVGITIYEERDVVEIPAADDLAAARYDHGPTRSNTASRTRGFTVCGRGPR